MICDHPELDGSYVTTGQPPRHRQPPGWGLPENSDEEESIHTAAYECLADMSRDVNSMGRSSKRVLGNAWSGKGRKYSLTALYLSPQQYLQDM